MPPSYTDLELDHPYLKTAYEAATAAADVQRDMQETRRIDGYKDDARDFVTNVDTAAESEMRSVIEDRHPNHDLLGEEQSADDATPDLTGGVTWLLDPIDGTVNYYHGIPPYCAIVGVVEDAALVAGVVYDTYHDDIYYALDGEGAYRNQTRLTVSATETLDTSLISLDIQGDAPDHDGLSALRNSLERTTHGTRQALCGGIMGSYLASGNIDAVIEPGAEPWDLISTILFTREAGGEVTTPDGRTDWEALRDGYLIATNGKIHEELMARYLDYQPGVPES